MDSLARELRAVLAVDPAALALEYKRRWYSWGDISTGIERIDSLLSQAGIGPGGRVGILIRNRPGQLFAILTVLATERCLVTLAPLLPDDKLANDLDAVRAPVMIGEADDLARPAIAEAIRRTGAAVIEVGVDSAQIRLVPGQERPTGSDLLCEGPGVAIEMLTSGTTGSPKRVPTRQQPMVGGVGYPHTQYRFEPKNERMLNDRESQADQVHLACFLVP